MGGEGRGEGSAEDRGIKRDVCIESHKENLDMAMLINNS